MRLRVLYTNGKLTYDFFWLEHTGNDVYCGPTKIPLKKTYHQSGKVHVESNGEREHHKWHDPLAELKGGWCMLSTAFLNTNGLAGAMKWPHYTQKPGEAILTIDGRSIPANASVQVDVGLCEPYNLAGIPQLEAFRTLERRVRQVLLHTDSVPWVYAVLLW